MQETIADVVGQQDESEVGPGALIGRYVVLSLIGRGGMGVVMAAYDPELDRKVALKLLRPSGDSADAARARLQREAQALAKLDHRNVVTVHDVGMHGEQLFVAMEFIDGQTLTEWLERPRTWQEVLRVFVEAGLGLAAAHEAGLVHRDFKPDNVMVGVDGRVRVMDFGLATSTDTPTAIERLTGTGTLLGTPAYMSLEQFRGGTIDARSDQFGFCVALYEGLHGHRPFAGNTVAQIAVAVEHGEIVEPARGTSVPSWLRRAVVRGLAREPEQRWPTMRELLGALTDDPAARRRRWWQALGGIGVLAAIVGAVLVSVQKEDADTCARMDQKLRGVWDEDRRAELEAALLGTKLGHAGATWDRVERRIDDYTQAWVAARTNACEATQRGEQSGELLDLRMACLDERLDHLRAAVDVLAHADAIVAGQAVSLVAGLPSLERCADLNALTAEVPPPDDPEVAKQVAALERDLVDARALERAGKYVDALALADAVVAAGEKLDYQPILARALRRQGSLQERSGEYERAEATLVRAYQSALAQRLLPEAASSSTTLMFLVGDTLVRPEEGLRWAIDADALSLAVGDDETRASYLNNRGALAAATGHDEEAREYYDQARALLERALGPEDPSVAKALYNLGNIAIEAGQQEKARTYYSRALAIFETALGPEHPELAACLVSRAGIDMQLGELARARTDLERSLAVLQAALGPNHPEVATSLNSLGGLATMEGDPRLARTYFERALEIVVDTFGPNHPHAATVHGNLGQLAEELGELDEARRQYERALAIRELAFGTEHPAVADIRARLAALDASQAAR